MTEEIQILKERIEVQQLEYDDTLTNFIMKLTEARNMSYPYTDLPLSYYIENNTIGDIIHWIKLGQIAEDLKLKGLRLQKLKEKLEKHEDYLP